MKKKSKSFGDWMGMMGDEDDEDGEDDDQEG